MGQDCSEGYCTWCGGSNELVSCKLCKGLFCTKCLKKNIGVELVPGVEDTSWHCCCCHPNLLQKLSLQLAKAVGAADLIVSSSGSDSDSSDDSDNSDDSDDSDAKVNVTIR